MMSECSDEQGVSVMMSECIDKRSVSVMMPALDHKGDEETWQSRSFRKADVHCSSVMMPTLV